MSRRIAVTINADGSIKAETLGVRQGKTCLDYVPLLEELLEAEAIQCGPSPPTTSRLTSRSQEATGAGA